MKKLTLRGEELRCIDAMPVGLLFDVSEVADGKNALKATAVYGKLLRTMVIDADKERLEAILYDTENILDIEQLNEAVGTLMLEYSGRPLEAPSPSPTGPAPTGLPTRVISFSQGTVKAAPPSSKVGRVRAS